MGTVKQTYHINAAPEDVWKALTEPVFINKWGGGPAKMNAKAGAKFSLWGGDVYGKNLKAVTDKLLVQEWYGGKWEKPSTVTFTLSKKDGGTELILNHENIPDEETKDIAQGWKAYYLGPLKELLEK